MQQLQHGREGMLKNVLPIGTVKRSRAKQHTGWLKFEDQFTVRHPDFLHSLAKAFPSLSPSELHICAMLRESLVSWEIADRLAITERSVENRRSIIRRKLGLRSHENLQVFLLRHN